MDDLANVYIEVPINLVKEWENYFWYAIGGLPSKLPIFKTSIGEGDFINKGQWIECGQSLKTIKSYDVNVISPITGLVKDYYDKGIIVQPKKNFIFPENAGRQMFIEVVNFGHKIESEISEYKAKSSLQRFIFDIKNGGSPWHDVESRRKSPEVLLKQLDKLLEARCNLISEIN